MNSIMAVFFFELKRIMTRGRAFWWGVVATFPVAIMLLMKKYVDFGPQEAATPQSITRTSPNSPTMMFAGFRSRCSTPRSWA